MISTASVASDDIDPSVLPDSFLANVCLCFFFHAQCGFPQESVPFCAGRGPSQESTRDGGARFVACGSDDGSVHLWHGVYGSHTRLAGVRAASSLLFVFFFFFFFLIVPFLFFHLII
jgi:hypothetical protein